VASALPAAAAALLAAAPCVGFSGARSPSPAALAAVRLAVAALPAGIPVVVGCAAGVDQRTRQLVPSARVFRASAFGAGRGAVAARSIACVRACAAAGGVWCAFPAGPAPAQLRPSSHAAACFCGSGNGTWASLALAIGSGLGAIVFLPASVLPPAAFGLVSAGAGWFVAQPPAQQLALL
jgi:hypothetical protein